MRRSLIAAKAAFFNIWLDNHFHTILDKLKCSGIIFLGAEEVAVNGQGKKEKKDKIYIVVNPFVFCWFFSYLF